MATLPTELQLQRDLIQGNLPYLTRWSRHEPAILKKETVKSNSDEWTKTKHKNCLLITSGRDGKTHVFPGGRFPHEFPRHPASTSIETHYRIDGNMRHIGTRSFTEMLLKELKGNWPGDYQSTRPKIPRIPRTAAYDRAREGYEYWYIEPKPKTWGQKQWLGGKSSSLSAK